MDDNRNESIPAHGNEIANFQPAGGKHNARKRNNRRSGTGRRPVYVNGRIDTRLYWRDGSTKIQYQGPDPEGTGEYVRRTTDCQDPVAAKAVADDWERRAANPHLRTASLATFQEGVSDYVDNQRLKGVKESTIKRVVRDTFGWFARQWGWDFPLNNLTAGHVQQFRKDRAKMWARRSDGATVGEYTIKRNVQYLYYMLEHAAYTGKLTTPVHQIIHLQNGCVDLPGAAKKRKRHPSLEAAWQIVMALPKHRQAHIAALAAGLMRLGESPHMRREDVNMTDQPRVLKTAGLDEETGKPIVLSANAVLIRGTKTDGSWGQISITPITRPIWTFVLANAPGKSETKPLFLPWTNPSKQIARVCKRLGLPHVSCHDFRRACAKWHRKQGMTPTGVSLLLRHTNDKLAQEVYADIDTADEIQAVYVKELRADLAVPNPFAAHNEAAVNPQSATGEDSEAVRSACAASDNNGSNEAQGDEDSPGKAGDRGNGAAVITPVHGERTGSYGAPVIQPDFASNGESGVRPMCAPCEPVSPAVSLADALGVLLRHVGNNVEAQQALTQALALMAAPKVTP